MLIYSDGVDDGDGGYANVYTSLTHLTYSNTYLTTTTALKKFPIIILTTYARDPELLPTDYLYYTSPNKKTRGTHELPHFRLLLPLQKARLFHELPRNNTSAPPPFDFCFLIHWRLFGRLFTPFFTLRVLFFNA